MQKIKTFLLTFIKSISQPAYYQDIFKANFSFSIKYLLVFNLILASILAVRVLVPVYNFDVNEAVDLVSQIYPQDLEISGVDGEITINQPLPYQVPIPSQVWEELGDNEIDQEIPFNIVTFTSDDEFKGIGKFDQYQSIAVVTESSLYFIEDIDSGEIRAYPISEFEEDFVIDAQMVEQGKQAFLDFPFIKNKAYIYWIAGLVLILLYPMMLILRFWTLLIYSGFVWIATTIFMKKKKLEYTKILQIGIHSLTLVILADWILDITGIFDLSGVWYFAVYFGWTMLVLKQVKTKKSDIKTLKSKAKKL